MRGSTPIAYLLTLRTFGTWLHGDTRGSHPSTPLHPWYARTSIETALGGRRAIADAILSTASRLILESHRGASCPRGVRISWLELACGERENQSRTLGCHRRLPSGGSGALYQVLDNSPSRPGRCSASKDPALVKARQYCVPVDRELQQSCRALCATRSGWRARSGLPASEPLGTAPSRSRC